MPQRGEADPAVDLVRIAGTEHEAVDVALLGPLDGPSRQASAEPAAAVRRVDVDVAEPCEGHLVGDQPSHGDLAVLVGVDAARLRAGEGTLDHVPRAALGPVRLVAEPTHDAVHVQPGGSSSSEYGAVITGPLCRAVAVPAQPGDGLDTRFSRVATHANAPRRFRVRGAFPGTGGPARTPGREDVPSGRTSQSVARGGGCHHPNGAGRPRQFGSAVGYHDLGAPAAQDHARRRGVAPRHG
jgi:hypothetical protein